MRRLLSVLILFCLGSTFLMAQEQDPNPLKFGPNAAPKLPSDACFYAAIHVKEIVAMPELKLVPWEIITAAGIDNWGFDPLLIERLDMIGGFLNSPDPAPQFRFVIVARTSKPIEVKEEAAMQLLDEQDLSVVVLNDRFTLVGDYEYMKHVVNDPPADGELKKQVARIGDSAIAWCALVTAPIEMQVQELVDSADEKHRDQFATVLKKTKLLAARLDLKSGSVPVILEAANEADAIEMEKVLQEFSDQILVDTTARAQAAAEQLPARVGKALVNYNNRFNVEFKNVSVFSRKGARISAKLDNDYYEVSQMGSYVSMMAAGLQELNNQMPNQQ